MKTKTEQSNYETMKLSMHGRVLPGPSTVAALLQAWEGAATVLLQAREGAAIALAVRGSRRRILSPRAQQRMRKGRRDKKQADGNDDDISD